MSGRIVEVVDDASDEVWIRPEQDLDEVFRSRYGMATTFRLYRGIYYTRGAWDHAANGYCQMSANCRLIGDGSDRTVIRLTSTPVRKTDGTPRPDLSVLRVGDGHGSAAYMGVEGVTIDGNMMGLPRDALVTAGLRFFGSHIRCQDVRVIGLKGDHHVGHEAFGISTINNPKSDSAVAQGAAIFRDCVVENCWPGSYLSGFSIGYRANGATILPSLVDNCRVDGGTGNHAAFTACHATEFRSCSSRGTKVGFYNDTDSVEDVLLDGCDFEVSYAGIYLVAQNPNDSKRRVRAIGCNFDLTGDAGPVMVLGIIDKSEAKAAVEEISIHASTIATRAKLFALVSTDHARLQDVLITQCVLPSHATVHSTVANHSAIATRMNWLRGGKPALDTLPAYRAAL